MKSFQPGGRPNPAKFVKNDSIAVGYCEFSKNCQNKFPLEYLGELLLALWSYFAVFSSCLCSCQIVQLLLVSWYVFFITSRRSHQRCSMKKGVPRNITKFTRKHLCQSLFLNKVSGLRFATLLKMRLWHICFLVNFAEFLRTPFLTEHLRWLLLNFMLDLLFGSS